MIYKILGMIFLTIVAILFVTIPIVTIVCTDWKHRWKVFFKELGITWLIMLFATPANQGLSEAIEREGFSEQVLLQWLCLSLIFTYVCMPFVAIRNLKT